MSDSPVYVPDAVARFFDNYLICLDKASIPEKQRRWYVRRVEEFIKVHSGRKIKTLLAPDITHYLETLGRQNRLSAKVGCVLRTNNKPYILLSPLYTIGSPNVISSTVISFIPAQSSGYRPCATYR